MQNDTFSIREWCTRIEALMISVCLGQKDVLTLSEAAKYTGRSKSNLYNLTSTGKIPFYCPEGKMIYFKRVELESWLLRNPVSTLDQIEVKAINYVITSKAGQRRAGKNAK